MGRLPRVGLIVAGGTLLAGCQLIAPSDAVQCKVDADCAARGDAFAGSVCVDAYCKPYGLRCVGHVPELVEDPRALVAVRLRVTEFHTPLPGIEVLTCSGGDELCDSPLGPPAITDAAGDITLNLAKNFRGTLQVKHPPAGSDYMKLKVHFFQAADLAVPGGDPYTTLQLLKRATLVTLGSTLVMPSPDAGVILAVAGDCDGRPLAGVRIVPTPALPASARQNYFVDGLIPSLTATETDESGAFGVLNAPAGSISLDAFVPGFGPNEIGHVTVWINADTISTFLIGPTHLPP